MSYPQVALPLRIFYFIMKTLIIQYLFFFTSITLYSQSIIGGFNSTVAGRSLSVDYSLEGTKIDIGLGLGVNINRYTPGYSINEFYYKKLLAENISDYFAIKGYIHQTIIKNNSLKLYGFYDIQIRRSGAKSQLFLGIVYDSTLIISKPEEGVLYQETEVSYGPYFWIENTVGLGIDINLSNKLYFRQKVGLGYTTIIGKDKGNNRVNHTGYTGLFGYLINFGIGYRIK
tara:strand:- start:1539 stop:2225 length:687 start_codon:yes stop_codon:yes gene_type:complete